MRFIQITAGTGSFHCGTCMRDNALVTALRRLGHDAILTPLYLPPVLDEDVEAESSLFYGGINVYLQQKSSVFRRTPRWLDGMLDRPGLLRAAAARAGMTRPQDLGELTLSTLAGETGRQAKELRRLTEWLVTERPDVVCLSNALLMGLGPAIRRATGAAVICILNGEDSYLDSLPEQDRQQAWARVAALTREMDAVVAVSGWYADLWSGRTGFPRERIHVIHPGIRLDGYGKASRQASPPRIGYLARMHPTKGLEVMVEAFIRFRSLPGAPPARLAIAGSQNSGDAEYARIQQQRLAAAGLADEAEFEANLSREEKIAHLMNLSVFSVPAAYGEAFGLYFAEALAAGLPVVQPDHGAFSELVPMAGAGMLTPPGEPDALARAWLTILTDRKAADAYAAAGFSAAREHFSDARMAEGFVDVCRPIVPVRV